jgi:hypothetical protein
MDFFAKKDELREGFMFKYILLKIYIFNNKKEEKIIDDLH